MNDLQTEILGALSRKKNTECKKLVALHEDTKIDLHQMNAVYFKIIDKLETDSERLKEKETEYEELGESLDKRVLVLIE